MRKSILGISTLTIIIGLMMVIAPQEVIKVAVIVIGVEAIGNGIYNLLKVRKLVADADFERLISIRAFISIAIGIIAITFPMIFANAIWNIMIYTLAIYLLVSAGLEIYGTLKLRTAGVNTKTFTTEIAASIIMSVILFILPASIGDFIIRIIGIILILIAGGFLYQEWKNKPKYVYSEDISNEDTTDTTINSEKE